MKHSHQTEASRRIAGVTSSDYWEFQPGQRVLTVEGLLGTVDEVQDGPHPGSEAYLVTLDGDMGGGEYRAQELSAMDYGPQPLASDLNRTAVWVDTPESNDLMSHAAETISAANAAKVWVDDEEDVTLSSPEGSNHTADLDYPELGSILVDRPPLAHSVTGALAVSRPSDWHVWRNSPAYDAWKADDPEASDPMPCDQFVQAGEAGGQVNTCAVCGWAIGAHSVEAGGPDGHGGFGPATASLDAQGGVLDRILDPWAKNVIQGLPPEYRPGMDGPGSRASFDWCRFRKNRRCKYAKELDVEATQEAGYAVWLPVDRGLCPRDHWDQQKACPVGEPGPHSGDPNARIEATTPWSEGGQRGGIPERTAALMALSSYYWVDSGEKIEPDEIMELVVAHGRATRSEVEAARRDRKGYQHIVYDVGNKLLYDLWGQKLVTIRTDEMYQAPVHPRPTEEMWDETFEWAGRPRMKAAAAFEFFSSWDDIQAKAKRIRAEDGVRILSFTDRIVAGQVRGDDNIYDTQLEYAPGGKAIAMWDCTCPWSRYSWGRTRQWKKYEGRQCAHALALGWEVQSRGMFGKHVTEDMKALARSLPAKPDLSSIENLADWMIEQVEKVEKRVTSDMQQVAKRVGGELEGLQFRVKSRSSLIRKLKTKQGQGLPINDPFAIIDDVLRYTMVFSYLEYSHDVQQAGYAFDEMGYAPVIENGQPKIENTWQRGDAYSGLAYTYEDPGRRVRIELQLHTSQSLYLKEKKAHKLYEEFRLDSTPLKRKQQLWDILKDIYDHLPIPPGLSPTTDATGFGVQKWYPRPASLDPSLREAPAIAVARRMLSDGTPFPAVAEHMTSLGARNGLAIVTEAMRARPFEVQVPGKVDVKVIDLDENDPLVHLDDGSTVPARSVLYPSFHPTKGLSLTGYKVADANSTGVMVALRPPQPLCEALAQEGGEPVEEMHVTLCYLGKTEEVSRDAAEAAVAAFAASTSVLTGKLAGFGQFLNGGEEPAVLIALWDVPGLDRFRLALKDTLAASGVKREENHGFTPHLTIAYGDEPFDELPEVPDEAKENITFESVILAYGGEWMEFPLAGPLAVAAELRPFPDRSMPSQPWPHAQNHPKLVPVEDRTDALHNLMRVCPNCGRFWGLARACQFCGFIGQAVAALVDDALQMISDGFEAGLVEEDAVSWFAPTEAGQSIAEERLGSEAATDRTMAYRSDVDSLTYCPGCFKSAKARNPDEDWSTYVPVRRSEFERGDIAICSAACGRTIFGGNEMRWGALTEETLEPAWGGHDAAVSERHEPDEPALPSTTSDDDEDFEFPHGTIPAAGSEKLAWLMQGTTGVTASAAAADTLDIAAAAKEFLAKTAVKTFTPAEQKQIINEGEGVTAGNLALLDIAGTHYESLEAAFAAEEEDDLWL